ncbi:hypothetical protein MMC11_000151 [Xylographa trunciseda]|nr:hypothetical protein [Xylographa trunciseda]
MSNSTPKTIRWGILATGLIAHSFTKDLLVDPKTRNVHSVIHTVGAAASSSSKSRAQQFLKDVGASSSAKAYGSYEELVKDPEIDIIYVATPHSHHYQNVMLCLEAGKNVLCEKAFTVNAAQLKILVKKAKEKNLFLMEAVWTRYFPVSAYVRELITSGRLGKVTRVYADFSLSLDPEKSYPDDKHRMVNLNLAGGAMLDLGIYSITWCFQTLYLTQPKESRKPPKVMAAMNHFRTGVDELTTILLEFPRSKEMGGNAHAIATTALVVSGDPDGNGTAGPGARIQGDKGEVQVFGGPICRPTKTRLILQDGTTEDKDWPQPGPGKGSGWKNGFDKWLNPEGEGHGMFWEADEAGMALVEGRKEGKYEDLEESVVIMEVMDEVRRQGGFKYPEKLESTEYPLNLD